MSKRSYLLTIVALIAMVATLILPLCISGCGGGGGSSASSSGVTAGVGNTLSQTVNPDTSPITSVSTYLRAAEGGLITVGETQVTIPPNTLSVDTTVTVTLLTAPRYLPEDSQTTPVGNALEINIPSASTIGAINATIPVPQDGSPNELIATRFGLALQPVPLNGTVRRSTTGSRGLAQTLSIAAGFIQNNAISVCFYKALPHPNTVWLDMPNQAAWQYPVAGQRFKLEIHGINSKLANMNGLRTQTNGFKTTTGDSIYTADAAFQYDYTIGADAPARQLAEQFNNLAPGFLTSGAELDIYAHSFGGDVALSFIAKQGGLAVVRRLFTIGTPHNGTPAADAQLLNGVLLNIPSSVNDNGPVWTPNSETLRMLAENNSLLESLHNSLPSAAKQKLEIYMIAGDPYPNNKNANSRSIASDAVSAYYEWCGNHNFTSDNDGIVPITSSEAWGGNPATDLTLFDSKVKSATWANAKLNHSNLVNPAVNQVVADQLLAWLRASIGDPAPTPSPSPSASPSPSPSPSPTTMAIWQCFRHDSSGTGQTTIDTSSNTGLQEWAHASGSSWITSRPPTISADGTIYMSTIETNGDNHRIYALTSDGTTKWSFKPGNSYIDGSVAIGSDNTIYAAARSGIVYAINPDGTQKWCLTTGGELDKSPTIGPDGTIYVGSRSGGNLFAINPDGTQKWIKNTGSGNTATPAIANDGSIVFCSSGKLYSIFPDSSDKWIRSDLHYDTATPAINREGIIHIGAYDDQRGLSYICAVNPDGTSKWSTQTTLLGSSPAVNTQGNVYILSFAGALHAFSKDGLWLWDFNASGNGGACPTIGADGTIYFGDINSWKGIIYAIRPNGTKRWSFETGGGIPGEVAIGTNGRIYASSYDSKLYCIK